MFIPIKAKISEKNYRFLHSKTGSTHFQVIVRSFSFEYTVFRFEKPIKHSFEATSYSDENRLLPVFYKKFSQSEITIVISMKNWSCVQNFGMIVYRESGFVQNGQN